MKRNSLAAAALACLVALGAPAAAQSTTKRAPDASTSTQGSENMKPRHEFDPYSTGSTPKARAARTADERKPDATAQRSDRDPAAPARSAPN